MKTTIIIPNYNGLSFMEPCFEALEKQTTKDFKILVVDNGSTDGSVEWLKEREIPSIFLPENTGFSGAVNVGIRAADTPYVILLNNDTKVAPHYVEALERAMDPDVPSGPHGRCRRHVQRPRLGVPAGRRASGKAL